MRWRWVAIICAITLVASACGGGGDSDSGDDRDGGVAEATSAPTESAADGAAGEEDDPVVEEESAASSDGGSPAPSEAPIPPEEDESTPGPEHEEIYGGTLVFALESETTGGWNPITTSAATSGHIVLRQIYDPLIIEGADGEPIPFLLESFSSNEDYSEWTFTLRPGITFHDGLPAN